MFFKVTRIFIIAVFLLGAFVPAVFTDGATISGQDPPTEVVNLFTGFQDGFLGFLRWLFPVMIASAAVIATLSIIFAGFQWMAGAISPPQVEAAKSRISASILGLAIALTSWLILNTINPDLVNLRRPKGFELKCPAEGCPSWLTVLFGTLSVAQVSDGVTQDTANMPEQQKQVLAEGTSGLPTGNKTVTGFILNTKQLQKKLTTHYRKNPVQGETLGQSVGRTLQATIDNYNFECVNMGGEPKPSPQTPTTRVCVIDK